jgi:DNA invertase Pin-like site-specific DNA recombinase
MKIAYARVSTRQQNLDMQLEAFRKEGCEKIYKEKKSAFSERPELIRAIDDLRSGDTLYLWSLDRIGRSIIEVISNVKIIHEKGASIIVIVQKIDTSTPTGRMLIPFFSILAELEVELRRERAAAGISIARASGRRLGRRPGISEEAMKTAQMAKKMYESKDPEYTVIEIYKALKISPRTLYKYLNIVGGKKRGGIIND